MIHNKLIICLLLSSFFSISINSVSAFAPNPSIVQTRSLTTQAKFIARTENRFIKPKNKKYENKSLSFLNAAPAALTAVTKITSRVISPPIRNAMLLGFALLLITRWQSILYPNSVPDQSFPEPLPPGKISGCPYFGSFELFNGMNNFLFKKASALGNTKIFKLFGFTKPMVVVSGSAAINKLLSHEFKKKESISQPKNFGNSEYLELMFGYDSMSYETKDAKKYHAIRKLVGQALTEESVTKGIPALQKASEEIVHKIVNSEKVVMSDVHHELTLDVAWRQIIGLDLKTDDMVKAFHENVKIWISSFANYVNLLLPLPAFMLKRTKAYKAKLFLTKLIEDKIDDIEKNGPDGSTLGTMVMATDDDNGRKLTRKQIIDNIFLLIVAGSETSSLTLTNAMLLLGMNPSMWQKLVKEQKELIAKYGTTQLTKEQLDKDCPYLDAVVKETMRILPLAGGGARHIDETFVLEGYQLPSKWLSMYSVHLTHYNDPRTFEEDGRHMDIHRGGFYPERWLQKDTAPTSEFIPWGAGHRFCLGHILATAEMKTYLAVLAREMERFDLLTDVENLKWKGSIIEIPKDGVVIVPHAAAADGGVSFIGSDMEDLKVTVPK